MPVNMDPSKRRHRQYAPSTDTQDSAHSTNAATSERKTFGEETEEDRIKALADAEQKNLWDATEVIDMDKW